MTESQRQAFEAWIKGSPYCRDVARYSPDHRIWPGGYKNIGVHLAWDAWQAAANQSADIPPAKVHAPSP